jgi:hypothetical protein
VLPGHVSVEPGALELGAGVPVISEHVLLLDDPIRAVRHVGAYERDLLLLPLRRHSHVEAVRMIFSFVWPSVAWPSALISNSACKGAPLRLPTSVGSDYRSR